MKWGEPEKLEGMREFTRPRVRLDSPIYTIFMFGFDIWDIAAVAWIREWEICSLTIGLCRIRVMQFEISFSSIEGIERSG